MSKRIKAGTFGNLTVTSENGMLVVKNLLHPLASTTIPVGNIALARKHFGKVIVHANDGSEIVIPSWKAGDVADFINASRTGDKS